jgi:Kef-type K+ transport system membrane component KefB
MGETVLFALFLIFTGAAVLATGALYARQSLLVGYIVVGVLLGPWGLGWVSNPELIQRAATIGIIFLLFLLGLNLHPQKLVQLFSQSALTTVASALVFGAAGAGVGLAFGFPLADSLVIGAATMFSSTILGLKLLPATALHHQHIGEVVIAVLLLQDLLAIILLIVLQGMGAEGTWMVRLGGLVMGLPMVLLVAFAGERYLLRPLWARFDDVFEYLFLTATAWCLALAELAYQVGLSHEIGAFTAGVALASSPISRVIAEHLRPVRDFFLVLYFFALGAGLQLPLLGSVLVPGLVLAAVAVALKPLVFRALLLRTHEQPHLAGEVGVRLGQMSEFALFVAEVAHHSGVVERQTTYLIQLATVASFIGSAYLIGLRHPTPIAASPGLRRD